jgi:hypothetical protein
LVLVADKAMVMRISVTVSKEERQNLPKTFMTRKGSKSFFSVAILDEAVLLFCYFEPLLLRLVLLPDSTPWCAQPTNL